MKNKSFLLGFSYLITQLICIYASSALIFWLGLFFALLFIISILINIAFRNNDKFNKYGFISIIIFSISLCMISYIVQYNNKIIPTLELNGVEVNVIGVVSELPYSNNNKYYYEIKTDNITALDENNKSSYNNTTIRVSASTDLGFSLYDKVNFKATLYSPQGNNYSSDKYLYSQGIYLSGYIEEYYDFYIVDKSKKDLKYYIQSFKKSIINKLINIYGSSAYLPIAIITGNKSYIPNDVIDNLKSSGIYHIMAVSGMHIGIFLSIVSIILSIVFKEKKISAIISIIFVLLYMSLVGFTPSVTRAGIMSIIVLFGVIISKKGSPINSLGFAIFIICLINPFAVGDVGLLLSVGSTLGIILYYKNISTWITEHLQKFFKIRFITKKIIDTISISISVMVFTIPIMIYFFGEIATLSIITNLLVINIVPIFMFCVIITLIGLDNIIVVNIVKGIGNFIEWSAGTISSIPYSTIKTNKKFVIVWLICTIFILLFIWLFKKYFRYKKTVIVMCLFVLVVSAFIYNSNVKDRIKITVLNCGNGYSIVINKNDSTVILGCGGSKGSYILLNYLENNDIFNIDYLIIPKTNSEYSRYFKQLKSNINIEQIGIYNEESITESYKDILSDCNIDYMQKYEYINIWDDINIDFYKAKSQVWSRIKVLGYSILICPSISDFELLPNDWLENNICIMNNITKNFNLCTCNMIILSCNEINTTNLSIIESFEGDIYSTAVNGNLCFFIKDGLLNFGSEGKWQD